MIQSVYLDLDSAWAPSTLGLSYRDARAWGPRLRFITSFREIDAFYAELSPDLGKFILYGSGDFHHLAGALIRRITETPFTLISFDNHPDWDIKPPYWACGGWAARTLKTGRVEKVSVWGLGNFELQWPGRLSADMKAVKAGRFEVHAWAERQSPEVKKHFDCMTRENWRSRFEAFTASLKNKPVYVTVDMDCLRDGDVITNWENGLFSPRDLAWAIEQLRMAGARVVGGDVCGAYSPPAYARPFQKFAAWWDHPKLAPIDLNAARAINLRSLGTIWNALTAE